MLKRKKHKKSELWVFYVGCYLDIRNRLLGTSRFKGTKGKGKVVWASTLGPLVSFLGAKRVQLRLVKVKGPKPGSTGPSSRVSAPPPSGSGQPNVHTGSRGCLRQLPATQVFFNSSTREQAGAATLARRVESLRG